MYKFGDHLQEDQSARIIYEADFFKERLTWYTVLYAEILELLILIISKEQFY